jgi:hypothetical protein
MVMETAMWKPILAGATALILAGGTLLYAQDRPPGPYGMGGQHGWHGGGGPGPHRQLSSDDIRAFTDARIAALKAGLTLTPEQERNWPPFEQAMRELAKERFERMQGDSGPSPEGDPIARLQRRADAVARRGTLLKQLAATAAPLYQSLDDAQKRRFVMLARFARSHHMRGHWRDGGDGR